MPTLIVLLLATILLASVFACVVGAYQDCVTTASPKINLTDESKNKNDINNNKMQDNLEEFIKITNTTDYVNVFVTLAPRDDGFVKFAESCGAKVEKSYTIIDAVMLTIPAGNITKIASYPAVDMVYMDEKVLPYMDTSVPNQYGDRTTLHNAGFDVDGSGVTIALIDSGVDASLSSLRTLPDGKTSKILAWSDFVNGRSQPYDDAGHGTFMASIAAAVGRSPYYAGVAPGANLIVGKCVSNDPSGTSLTPMFDALQWVLDNKDKYGGIGVLSMSIGAPYDQVSRLDGNHPIDQAVEKLVSAGIPVAVAGGNEGPGGRTIGVPGTAKNVIAVGAVDNSYNIWSGSSRGPTADGRVKPDICAIGYILHYSSGGEAGGGTSEATPHVAGAIALLLQYHNMQLDKYNSATAKSAMKLPPATTKDILLKSVSQPSKTGPYPNNVYGNGILNIKNALTVLKNKNYLPLAKFTTNGELRTGTAITFDASGSFDPIGDTLTYSWDFGDGTMGSGKTTTHMYSTAKDYTATLTVKDSKNNANDFGVSTSIVTQLTSTKKTLTIVGGSGSNKLPVASVMINGGDINKGDTLTFPVNEIINFDASKSSDSDGQIASVSWNMGDGSALKSGKTATHFYAADGRYSVVAKVTDNTGGETQFGFTIVVSTATNKLPVAKVSVNNVDINKGDELNFSAGEDINLDASKSSDPDGLIATMSWNMGDGSALKSGKTIKYSYSTHGSYSVTVKVTDDTGGQVTFTFTINIGNTPPIPDIRINGKTVSNGETIRDIATSKEVEFDASHSYDRESSVQSIAWDMGDGTQKSGKVVTHAYTDINTYNVSVELTDDAGAKKSFSFKVETSNTPPIITQAEPIVNISMATKNAAFLFASPPSSDTNGRIVSAIWDFGDGVTSDEQNPSHKYDRSGTYTVTYTVTDDAGAIASVSTNVTVTKQPPIAKASGNVKANIRDDVIFDASRSSSPDGEIVSYLWSIEGNDYTEAAIPYRFSERGDYTVTLTVTDEEGLTNTTTVSVNVANMLPAAVMGKIPETINTGDAVEFKATNSFDFDGEIDKYTWNFGDGKTGTGKTTSHVYEKPGTYNAVLTIWDNDGETNTTSFMVNVQGVAGVTAESYAYIGGIGIVCVIVAVIVFCFYFKKLHVFGTKQESTSLKTFQTSQRTEPPPLPSTQQGSHSIPYGPQQYQTQTRPPQPTRPVSNQYSHTTQPSYPTQSTQYGTCPNCGGVVQIQPSTGRYITIQCPSCGAESTIE
ncbi:MAG: PKD domain-containing protein [Thermoplasmata archaeon]